ncbi:hypothetical protein L6452_00516 [Arctium lappa]|uniref:Uncharacterized protein n=1 Tax=Arctium lappa TaxID=4217 RepID=A0ACB9FE86_ARCLA|nr:hypothetical protein L6452_00516 [Arctium lappa]
MEKAKPVSHIHTRIYSEKVLIVSPLLLYKSLDLHTLTSPLLSVIISNHHPHTFPFLIQLQRMMLSASNFSFQQLVFL